MDNARGRDRTHAVDDVASYASLRLCVMRPCVMRPCVMRPSALPPRSSRSAALYSYRQVSGMPLLPLPTVELVAAGGVDAEGGDAVGAFEAVVAGFELCPEIGEGGLIEDGVEQTGETGFGHA